MPVSTLIVLNPRAGASAARFARLQSRLQDVLGDVEVARTRGARDAERIAREAVRAGVERLVVAGGDGTLSEVVSGLLAAGLGGHAELAVLPLGSGCDFARSIGTPRDLAAAVDALATGGRHRVDAGRIRYCDHAGQERTAYFLNEASFGLSGGIVDLVNRAGKRWGPTLAFALGTVAGILRHRSPDVVIRVDERIVHRGPLSLAVAANGRYFGSGMQVAPEARLDDGAFDVVIARHLAKPRLLALFPRIYGGTHLTHPCVSVHRGLTLEAESHGSEPARIDVDGEPLGRLPVRIELLPKAIRLFGVLGPVAAGLVGTGADA
ncbi:MAG: diacylglycerol kinase family lipid kinase [Deltaproteobacteria bacterium]|nr:diacylglycerol kinase family lipid kinase [Deltaproteobacteria bacterium]MBW2383333.1 diacylglycerol kinase family lipid kinase [Deltaproteobacteria bacterium]MBW2697875.1 diacylglycerol kinase family lipid kinase [Deltaproteobacteria bacterium]